MEGTRLVYNGVHMWTDEEKYETLSAAVRKNNFEKDIFHDPDSLVPLWFRLLKMALLKKDLEIAEYFLYYYCKVRILEKYTETPLAKEALHLAVVHGNVKIVEKLLHQGVPIHSINAEAMTPFHIIFAERSELNNSSIDENFLPIVDCLLNHGADVNQPITFIGRPKNLYTALHFAVESENAYGIDLLLKMEGIIVNAKSKTGLTPLHIAALNGNIKIINKLLEKGADIHIKSEESKIPLFLAIEKGHSEAIKILLNRTYVNRFLILNRSMYLISAIIGRNKAIFESLFQNKGDVSTTLKDGTTLLHIAAQAGCEDILRTFLDSGADIYAKRNDGRTPLHQAVEGGHAEIVDILLNHKTDTHADLVKKGIFASGLESDLTPREISGEKGNRTIIKLLLLHGVDIRGTGKLNKLIPLDFAARLGDRGVVEDIYNAYLNLDLKFNRENKALYFAIHYEHEDVVKLLLEYGVNPNSKITKNYLPLHAAFFSGNYTIVKYLVENGADVNVEFTVYTITGFTILHLTARSGRNEIVKLLHDFCLFMIVLRLCKCEF